MPPSGALAESTCTAPRTRIRCNLPHENTRFGDWFRGADAIFRGMRSRAVHIFLALSMLLVQISGLHVHLCMGQEVAVDHPRAHYADSGLIFGEHHSEDDSDDREVSLPSSTFASFTADQHQPNVDFALTWVLYVLPAVERSSPLLIHAARGAPPQMPLSSLPPDLPPVRGPPAYS